MNWAIGSAQAGAKAQAQAQTECKISVGTNEAHVSKRWRIIANSMAEQFYDSRFCCCRYVWIIFFFFSLCLSVSPFIVCGWWVLPILHFIWFVRYIAADRRNGPCMRSLAKLHIIGSDVYMMADRRIKLIQSHNCCFLHVALATFSATRNKKKNPTYSYMGSVRFRFSFVSLTLFSLQLIFYFCFFFVFSLYSQHF